MGILDDAIREHLELKRQHGAGSDDLERLEKEAFGPLTRPGDPDFADPGAAEAAAAEQGETAVSEAPKNGRAGPDEWFSDEEETRVLAQDPAPSEQARVEHAALGDTADHPAPGPLEPPPSAELPEAPEAPESREAPEPPEAPERAIFDADDIDFGELDIDLDDVPEGAPRSAATESEGGAGPADFGDLGEDLQLDLPDDPPAGEHQAVPADREADLAEDDEDAPPDPVPPRQVSGAGEEPAGEEPEEEDLLEETPDFLQDAPEGERLWFEQRPPRDFDFEDD